MEDPRKMCKEFRVCIDRPNGYNLRVSIPEEFVDDFQRNVVEYVQMLARYYCTGGREWKKGWG